MQDFAQDEFHPKSTSSLSRFSAGIGRMKTLLIVYHSRTGGTRQMAEVVVTVGAVEPGVDVRLLPGDRRRYSD